jgi:hypothetical protein
MLTWAFQLKKTRKTEGGFKRNLTMSSGRGLHDTRADGRAAPAWLPSPP